MNLSENNNTFKIKNVELKLDTNMSAFKFINYNCASPMPNMLIKKKN